MASHDHRWRTRQHCPYYLLRVIDNERLTLVTGASAEKILIEHGKAVGVRYSVKGKSAQDAYASKEVLVTAGAIATPKLLLLSGIGPADELRELDIEVAADNPQVGKNLQDRLMFSITARTPGVPGLQHDAKGIRKIAAGLEWLTFHHDGVVGTNVLEAGGFFDTDNDGRVDTQMFVQPLYDLRPEKEGQPQLKEIPDGVTVKVANVRPESRGEIRLASKDPAAAPQVQANYLSAPGDLEAHIRAVRLGLKFFEAPSLKRITEDVSPNPAASDDELVELFKRWCTTQFHPVSSCRMGATPEDSVVDLRLRVWGVENLRVADASVMPHVTSGNTNAPTIMVAERAAEMIVADYKG